MLITSSVGRSCCYSQRHCPSSPKTDSDTHPLGRSKSPTAASFLRPKQTWDESRSLLQALREKYISPEEANNAEIVFISGKHAEEVGLEKLARRQAQLQGIHTLVLDRMCIRYRQGDDEADRSVAELCANITTLDLGGNLFETWDEILRLCRLFPKLHSLTLDGNRLRNTVSTRGAGLPNIRYLGLADTLLEPAEISSLTSSLPALQTIILTNNELEAWESRTDATLPSTVHSIDLSNNNLTTLSSLAGILTLPSLHTLILRTNKIGSHPHPQPKPLSQTLQTLDLRHNQISTWRPISSLPPSFPSLQNLLIASNPLYAHLTSATDNNNTPLTPSDGYTLTLARLPLLQTLNYSTVTEKERLNAETYYLGTIARELANASSSDEETRAAILSSHPRWEALCAEYGEPVVDVAGRRAGAGGEVDPGSLAARLVRVEFCLGGGGGGVGGVGGVGVPSTQQALSSTGFTWTEDIPRSASIYSLLGRVGKRLDVRVPLGLRLVWETGERDPVGAVGGVGAGGRAGAGGGDGPEYWDSSDDDGENGDEDGDGDEVMANMKGQWVAREVELAAGTRAVGSYLEGRGGRVRVEVVGDVS